MLSVWNEFWEEIKSKQTTEYIAFLDFPGNNKHFKNKCKSKNDNCLYFIST